MKQFILIIFLSINLSYAQYFYITTSDGTEFEEVFLTNYNDSTLIITNVGSSSRIQIPIASIVKITEKKRNNFAIVSVTIPAGAVLGGLVGMALPRSKSYYELSKLKNVYIGLLAGAAVGTPFGFILGLGRKSYHNVYNMKRNEKLSFIQAMFNKYYSKYLSENNPVQFNPCFQRTETERSKQSFYSFLYSLYRNRWKISYINEGEMQIKARAIPGLMFPIEVKAQINSNGVIYFSRASDEYIPLNIEKILSGWIGHLNKAYFSVECAEQSVLEQKLRRYRKKN